MANIPSLFHILLDTGKERAQARHRNNLNVTFVATILACEHLIVPSVLFNLALRTHCPTWKKGELNFLTMVEQILNGIVYHIGSEIKKVYQKLPYTKNMTRKYDSEHVPIFYKQKGAIYSPNSILTYSLLVTWGGWPEHKISWAGSHTPSFGRTLIA